MMSSTRKSIDEKDAAVEENISLPDDSGDTSESAENYEPARQLEDTEESKELLGSASDADGSNLSSSDSTQIITEADVNQKSGIGSNSQKIPNHNFEIMKFEKECQAKFDDDESSYTKESKLSVEEDMKFHGKPKCDSIKIRDSALDGGSKPCQVLETGSKITRPDFDKQVGGRYSSSESVTISVKNIKSSDSNIAEKPSEIATKKIISKKCPEKFKKTMLGSSEIAADVIEDAIDHTFDSVFANVGSTDFITAEIPNTGIVTDITEDAVDNTDQAVFMKIISTNPMVKDVPDKICATGKVTVVTGDSTDQTNEARSTKVTSSDLIAATVTNIFSQEVSPLCSEDTGRTVEVESDYQTLDLQEIKPCGIFSTTASPIFSQLSQIERETVSDTTTEPFNLHNIDIEKTESSIDSNPSDDRMEFSSASTVPSAIGYHTDTEKMECSSDTYSGFESFKIDDESNSTLEKMECKSESSTSRDKMDTESLSLKSYDIEGMEYSSDAMSSFEQKSIGIREDEPTSVQSESTSVQENELISPSENLSITVVKNDLISVQGIEPISDQRNEVISVQEISSISFQEDESIKVHVNKSVDVQESESIGVQENESMGVQKNKSITVQENESIGLPESTVISVYENESTCIQGNESINNQQDKPVSIQENESIDILQREDASNQILESVSCLIGDFVTRTIQEAVCQQPQESLCGLLNESTIGQVLTDIKYTASNESDSSSNEIKSIYESDTGIGKGIERKFTIPRKEASDTEDYDYEHNPASCKEVVNEKLSSRSDTSLKRRNSTEDQQVGKITDVKKQSNSSIADLPDADNGELKDTDNKKGHKKLKK